MGAWVVGDVIRFGFQTDCSVENGLEWGWRRHRKAKERAGRRQVQDLGNLVEWEGRAYLRAG